jgi:zinc transport system permease protein
LAEFLADLHQHTFLRHAMIVGILAAVPCGVIGTYVVTRRITYIAGAIAHSVLAGLGAARYCQAVFGWSWLHPLYGAVAAAVISALVIGTVSLLARQREDTVIGAVWAVGMAVGILFISRTPGYNEDLMSYLFGNILMVSFEDINMIIILDIVILLFSILFYNKFLVVCFDEEFARVRGIRVEAYYLLLLCLTALTVVLLVTVVGVVLVIALLTLPAAIASHFSHKLWVTMVFSAFLTSFFTLSGLALAYGPDLPAGATTIVLAGGVYLIVAGADAFRTRRG